MKVDSIFRILNHSMRIGERIRAIREARKLSQSGVEKRSGLLRAYVSRIENGHTEPSDETLEKLARAVAVLLYYQFFYEGEKRAELSHLPARAVDHQAAWGTTRKEMHFWKKFRHLLARMRKSDRRLLLYMAQKMAGR